MHLHRYVCARAHKIHSSTHTHTQIETHSFAHTYLYIQTLVNTQSESHTLARTHSYSHTRAHNAILRARTFAFIHGCQLIQVRG